MFVEPAGLLCFMPNQTKRLEERKLYLWLIHLCLDKIWASHLPVMRREQVCGVFFVSTHQPPAGFLTITVLLLLRF